MTAQCCNANCNQGRACPVRQERARALMETTKRYARTAGEAFKDATYSNPIEGHVPPPLWTRIGLFFKRLRT